MKSGSISLLTGRVIVLLCYAEINLGVFSGKSLLFVIYPIEDGVEVSTKFANDYGDFWDSIPSDNGSRHLWDIQNCFKCS
jgi:hypothetical protein